jgi:uncharacterized membrane protein YbhN (UPF0104 family)
VKERPTRRPGAAGGWVLLLAAAFVYLFVYRVGWRSLAATLGRFDLRFALPVLIAQALFHLLGGLGLWVLARGFRPLTTDRLIRAYWRALATGYWTPAAIGEASIAWWLRPEISLNEGLALVTVDKVVTLVITTLLALPAAAWLGALLIAALPPPATWIAITAVVVAGIALLAWLREGRRGGRVRLHLRRFLLAVDRLGRRSASLLIANSLITVTRLVVGAGVFWLAIAGVHGLPEVGFPRFVILTSCARLVTLPMPTPNGLGVFEVALVELFGSGSAEPAAVLAGALVARLASLLLVLPAFLLGSPRREVPPP